MEVDGETFNALLPSIIKHIAESHFVSFDLELSGIPSQRRREPGTVQNLQERYHELKLAAEKYHILQVGLTCVKYDLESQKYLLRPYNFNINPLLKPGIEIERDFTFSSSAVDFLLHHGFQMDHPYQLGVRYLTRNESRLAQDRAKLHWDKADIPDIVIDSANEQALGFMQRVRDDIDAWQRNQKAQKLRFLVGDTSSSTLVHPEPIGSLNRFQRRLVHQLVRAEYPQLSTTSRGDFVQVSLKDQKGQANMEQFNKRRLAETIHHATGFRWVTEALVGGDLSGVLPASCGPEVADEPGDMTLEQFTQRLEQLQQAAISREKVLVGHNCFLDLVYFYNTFIGELPETVAEFQATIHEMFDLVIDTKYMATAGPGGGGLRNSQLWQIDDHLSSWDKPELDIATGHPTYNDSEQFHEAGYDSYATAKVLLRLSLRKMADAQPGELDSPRPTLKHGYQTRSATATDDSGSANVATPSANTLQSQDNVRKTKKLQKSAKPLSTPKDTSTAKNRFSTNVFDKLREVSNDDSAPHSSAETPASSSSAAGPVSSDDPLSKSTSIVPPLTEVSPQDGDHNQTSVIPPWGTEFWRIYGNKLRVFGTVEEVCDLDPDETALSGEDNGTMEEATARPMERRPSLLASLVEKCKSFVI